MEKEDVGEGEGHKIELWWKRERLVREKIVKLFVTTTRIV